MAAALIATAAAFGAVLLFSDGGHGAGPGSGTEQRSDASASTQGSEAATTIIVDGVNIYTTTVTDGGAAL